MTPFHIFSFLKPFCYPSPAYRGMPSFDFPDFLFRRDGAAMKDKLSIIYIVYRQL